MCHRSVAECVVSGVVGLVAGGLLGVAEVELQQEQCQGFRCLQNCGNALYLHPQQVSKAYSKVLSDLGCKSDYTHRAVFLRKHCSFCDEEAREIIPSGAGSLLEEQLKMVIF